MSTPAYELTNSSALPPDAASRRFTVMSISGLLTSLLIAGLSIVPSPYAIGSPGPTFDTLGEVQDVPLVAIDGAPTFEATGELRLTTVSVSRGSSRAFTMGPVIEAWLSPSKYVTPEVNVFGAAEDEELFDQRSQQEWISSQESAAVSALETVGIDVPAELHVAWVDAKSHALGLLEEGDRILAIDGNTVTSFSDLSDHLAGVSPGEDVTLSISRDGTDSTVTFPTLDIDSGRAVMGVFIDPRFELPIDVTVQIDSVGGPSAGLMFSLAIIDKLTEVDELDGALIAGTGAISADGDVLPIGGIRLKLHGARDAGSEFFLAPVENCPEVIGHIPHGLRVVAVDTLEDAYDAVVSIGHGRADELPTC